MSVDLAEQGFIAGQLGKLLLPRVVQKRNKARVRTSGGVRLAGRPAGFLPEIKARLGLGSKARKSSRRQNRMVSLSLKSRCDNMGNASQVFPYVVPCSLISQFRHSGLLSVDGCWFS